MPALPSKNNLLGFVVFLLVLVPASGAADKSPAPRSKPPAVEDPCLTDAKCNELYETARTLSAASQYEAALVNYQSAYARRPMPWLLINIGRMQQKAGRAQQAITTYQRFLHRATGIATDTADAELQARAREYLSQAEHEVEAQKAALYPTVQTPVPQPLTAVGTPVAAESKQPIYKKWWLWTAVGVVVAGAAVGVGIGVASARPDLGSAAAVRPFGS